LVAGGAAGRLVTASLTSRDVRDHAAAEGIPRADSNGHGVQVMQVVLSLQPGGTERLVIELSRHLHRVHGMHICCLDAPGVWADEVRALGVTVSALNRQPGFCPSLGAQVARVARVHRARVLHCHHYSPYVYGSLARIWHPCGVVFTEHGRNNDAPPSPRRRIVNTVLSRMPTRVFSVSEDLRRHMEAEGFTGSPVGVIRNGIQIDPLPDGVARASARAQLKIRDSDTLIGAVGRLDPVKDLGGLLDAFRLLQSTTPRCRLVIIGDGPERARIAEHAKAVGIGDSVQMTGYRQDVRALLAGLDVYVNSSIFEGISLTILEAMAAAIPVVATRVGGTPEVVVDGDTGRLVEARSPTQLADALGDLSLDRKKARTMGLRGRQRVEADFSIGRMVEEYARVYASFELR
jgi:glycosyltransferase involved in cell wall biosynthesis